MSKRGLKIKEPGREPNDLCVCGSGLKYKRCCGKGQKGTGKSPRESANRKDKIDRGEMIKETAGIVQFEMIKRSFSDRRERL